MNLMTILVILALLATIASLVWGITSMAHGGAYDEDHSAKLMNSRVIFQGIAILLLFFSLSA
ncbi:MAG: twin transmembrane helix small protein [Acidiferrobacterales bacterium]